MRQLASRVAGHLRWPAKRVLDRIGLLQMARSVLGQPPGLVGGWKGVDLVILTPGRSEVAVELVSLASQSSLPAPRPRRDRTPDLLVAGGWGYGNIGDEAILAGYLGEFAHCDISGDVLSVWPSRTLASSAGLAQDLLRGVRVVDESLPTLAGRGRPLVLAGGGYLNGSWRREITGKLTRLIRVAAGRPVVGHAVEVRGLSSRPVTARLGRQLLAGAALSVRDVASRTESRTLSGTEAVVVPDAISLLVPHLSHLVAPVPRLAGRMLVNLMDVPARADSAEAEFRIDNWRERCRGVIETAGSAPLGLALDESDAAFLADLGLEVVLPQSVRGLVSVLAVAEALLTTRMHPALLATMLGRPTVALPYCGKVVPTLSELGLAQIISREPDLGGGGRVVPPVVATGLEAAWSRNHTLSSTWLRQQIANLG